MSGGERSDSVVGLR